MRLTVQGTQLRCIDNEGGLRWNLSIDDLVLVAEYTTNEGPQSDDYFLIFCTVEDGKALFAACSFYTNGRDEVLSAIGERLGSPLNLRLCGSTELDSNVLWPAELAGQKYFRFQQAEPTNFRERLRETMLGPAVEMFLSDPVQQYVREQLKLRNTEG